MKQTETGEDTMQVTTRFGAEVDTEQAIRSLADAENLADLLEERLLTGQSVGIATWKIERGNSTPNPFDFEFTVSRPFGSEEPRPVSAGGLAHFIFWPNRKEINDALTSGVLQGNLEAAEQELFDRLI